MQEGNGVTLCCELSKPGVPVEWKKEDMVLTSGEKYQMRQSGSKLELLIRKSLPEDSGTYSCICDDMKTSATVIITGETHGLCNNKNTIKMLLINVAGYHSLRNPSDFQAEAEEPGSCGGG